MKMTKRDKFVTIGKIFEGIECAERDEILEFVNKEIAALDAKSAKARSKAAEKKAASDVLREKIYGIVEAAEAPMTVAEVISAMPEDNLTPAKVVARMTALINEGMVTKETIKANGRKLVAYTRA